jgi:hypothetical protein
MFMSGRNMRKKGCMGNILLPNLVMNPNFFYKIKSITKEGKEKQCFPYWPQSTSIA